jgi:AcrR family transcriptional regulator
VARSGGVWAAIGAETAHLGRDDMNARGHPKNTRASPTASATSWSTASPAWHAADGERKWSMTSRVDGTSEALLRAATALVNEQGHRGASVDRISARLNLTKGSLYHHHDNKLDLISECFERSFVVIRQALSLAMRCARPPHGMPRGVRSRRAQIAARCRSLRERPTPRSAPRPRAAAADAACARTHRAALGSASCTRQ